ncbi:MAG: pyruvate dehydrogenase (acetyl-transferring) E1 component subunit alpha [Bacteroidetes bacterium]|nr:MAG: pyruvate dehydrogenase (acetyl-transferring) E1 component subunit alpha [Bacteroidota bacterium]
MANKVKLPRSKETYLSWYELMLRLRRFEEKAGSLYGQQKIRGFCHLYIGQEAIASGMMEAMDKDDNLITAYRDHGLAIAKGMSMREAMAELYGKATGCSKGKGGSMHFFDKENRFFGGHGIVGGQIGLGAGIAFADKYNKTNRVTVSVFGDGSAWQGMLHESINLAKLWNLPVVFVCENNGYAMGTSQARTTVVDNIASIASYQGMPTPVCDGMDPDAVADTMAEVIEHARSGKGPSLVEIKTYRFKGHSMSDPQKYRTRDELNSYRDQDPIQTVKGYLLETFKVKEDVIKAIDQAVKEEVADCIEFAENSPWPDNAEVYKDIYQDEYPFLTDDF